MSVTLRAPAPGDWGWIASRHGALYAAECGWGARYEAFVARLTADFVDGLDPAGEAAWIAELATPATSRSGPARFEGTAAAGPRWSRRRQRWVAAGSRAIGWPA